MVIARQEVHHIFSVKIVQILCTVHLALQAEGEVVGHGALEVWIPGEKVGQWLRGYYQCQLTIPCQKVYHS